MELRTKEAYPKDILSNVLTVNDLSSGAKLVILSLISHNNKPLPRQIDIAKEMGMSIRTVSRHMAELGAKDILSIKNKTACLNLDKYVNLACGQPVDNLLLTTPLPVGKPPEPVDNFVDKSASQDNINNQYINKDKETTTTTRSLDEDIRLHQLELMGIDDRETKERLLRIMMGHSSKLILECVEKYITQKKTIRIGSPFAYFNEILKERIRRDNKSINLYDKKNLPRSRCCHAITYVDINKAVKCVSCHSILNPVTDVIKPEGIDGDPTGPQNQVNIDKVKMYQKIGPRPGKGIDLIVDPHRITQGAKLENLKFTTQSFKIISGMSKGGVVPSWLIFIRGTNIPGYQRAWEVFNPRG